MIQQLGMPVIGLSVGDADVGTAVQWRQQMDAHAPMPRSDLNQGRKYQLATFQDHFDVQHATSATFHSSILGNHDRPVPVQSSTIVNSGLKSVSFSLPGSGTRSLKIERGF